MPTVIKATDRNAGIHGVAYNFTDMAVEADRRLGKYHAEAVAIVEKAKQEARQIRQQAHAEGRRAAAEEITRQLQQQLATLMPALHKTIEDIKHSKQAWLTHWEKSGVHLATAIAERLIRRHLPETPDLTLTLVREALELAAGSAKIRVHLNPADHQRWATKFSRSPRSFPAWPPPSWWQTIKFHPAASAWKPSSAPSTRSAGSRGSKRCASSFEALPRSTRG